MKEYDTYGTMINSMLAYRKEQADKADKEGLILTYDPNKISDADRIVAGLLTVAQAINNHGSN